MTRLMLATCVLVGFGGYSVSGERPLLKRQQAQLARIIDAAQHAGPVEIVKAATPVAGKLSDSHLATMNEALVQQGLPSVGELLVAARMRLDDLKRSKAVPQPKFRERLRMLATIADLGDEALAPAQKSLADDVQPPQETMKAYEERLRRIAAQRRKLLVAIRQAAFGRSLMSKISQHARQRLGEAESTIIDRNGPQRIGELQQAGRTLFELQLALRLKRLDYGIEVLKETKGKLTKERFLAAYNTGLDGRFLREVLRQAQEVLRQAKEPAAPKKKGKQKKKKTGQQKKEPDPPANATQPLFERAELNDPNLQDLVAERIKQAEELAGDLAVKTRHFFEGLDWWLRGRFGWGPEVSGLVKSERSLKKPELLFEVHMPVELPRPLAPTNLIGNRPTHLDRRHHYTWTWEERKLVKQAYRARNSSPEAAFGFRRATIKPVPFDLIDSIGFQDRLELGTGLQSKHVPGSPGWGHGSRLAGIEVKFKSVHLPPQDPRLVYRLVGFVEYTKALEHLDQFVKAASLRELELADEIVRDHDEYIIHTNLSRRLEKQPNVLSERGWNERDDFARHGLPWMLALARIELGAMLAGFTSAKDPFRLMVPPPKSPRFPERYGAKAYHELLVDGLRTHYWSLKKDPAVWNYRKTGVPENHLVTYTRRVTMARQFLISARKASAGLLSQPQLALIARWEQEIATVHRALLYCLAKKQGSKSTITRHERGAIVMSPDDYITGYYNTKTGRLRAIFSRQSQVNRSPLPELLELIDPTLKFCQCR